MLGGKGWGRARALAAKLPRLGTTRGPVSCPSGCTRDGCLPGQTWKCSIPPRHTSKAFALEIKTQSLGDGQCS